MTTRWRAVVQHPSGLLLMAQLLAVVAYPFLDGSRVGSAVLGVISMVAVGLALWVVRSTPALTLIAVGLGLPAIVMTLLEAVLPGEDWVTLTSALPARAVLLLRVLQPDPLPVPRRPGDHRRAVRNRGGLHRGGLGLHLRVHGGDDPEPGSIEPLSDGTERFFDLLFFSFTNLTSVGLSDILPTGSHARSFVILEQVAGVLYVAMVISRLVALTVQSAS